MSFRRLRQASASAGLYETVQNRDSRDEGRATGCRNLGPDCKKGGKPSDQLTPIARRTSGPTSKTHPAAALRSAHEFVFLVFLVFLNSSNSRIAS